MAEHAAKGLTLLVVWLLMALVALAVIGLVRDIVEPIVHRDFTRAAIDGLDGAFLVIILLEVVHTTLAHGSAIQKVRQFLVVAITAAVRSGLERAVDRISDPHSVVVNVALDALGVLVLVVALRLAREHHDHHRTHPPVA
jgi:hypothetical protein